MLKLMNGNTTTDDDEVEFFDLPLYEAEGFESEEAFEDYRAQERALAEAEAEAEERMMRAREERGIALQEREGIARAASF